MCAVAVNAFPFGRIHHFKFTRISGRSLSLPGAPPNFGPTGMDLHSRISLASSLSGILAVLRPFCAVNEVETRIFVRHAG